MTSRIRTLALAAALLAATQVQAANVQYFVNQISGNASVTGFITIDGTLGHIESPNIVDWSLTLNDGSSTDPLSGVGKFTLKSNNSQLYFGSTFYATETELLFNFSGSATAAHFQNPILGSGKNYLVFDGVDSGIGPTPSSISWGVNGSPVSIQYSGYTAIAAVPEPATYGMLLSGLAMLGWAGRRKFTPGKQA